MTAMDEGQLDPGVLVEPLQRRFPLWLHTVSPATGALHLAKYHLPVLRSYLKAPAMHVRSARTPALRGGPFVDVEPESAGEVEELVRRIESEAQDTLAFADDVAAAYASLADATGFSLDEVMASLPERLKPYVEVAYDVRNQPDLRFHETALYRSEYFARTQQSVRLARDPDVRPSAFSTPRVDSLGGLHLDVGFEDERLTRLLESVHRAVRVRELADDLEVDPAALAALFTEPGWQPERYAGPGVRVRYFGHAGVLVETASTSVLVDPFITANEGPDRFSFRDLPPTVDYCLITHGHADHLVAESLLRLRTVIDTVVVAKNSPGVLQDPSPAAYLRALGYRNVVEVSPYDVIDVPGGCIVPFPFTGEHADLAISAKTTWGVRLDDRSVFLGADTRVPTPEMFRSVPDLIGAPDLLLIGMECDGAPLTWLYGPLLAADVSRPMSKSRTLSGADAAQARELVEVLKPSRVSIYAMGFEPYLDHIMALNYEPDALQLQETERFGEHCREAGIPFSVLNGKQEWLL